MTNDFEKVFDAAAETQDYTGRGRAFVLRQLPHAISSSGRTSRPC